MCNFRRHLIVFTGHRNCVTIEEELQQIKSWHPNSWWLQGGAQGFDRQVLNFAKENNIICKTERPDYLIYPPKIAPIKRNQLMVDIMKKGDILVACWDGRKYGGTYQTIQYAESKNFSIKIVKAIPI